MDAITRPFWGRAAVMDATSNAGFILIRDSITFPAEGVPLIRSLHGERDFGPPDVIGHVKNIWYGDESGLQIILFDGEWVANAYLEDLYAEVDKVWVPSLFINRIQWREGAGGGVIEHGELRSINLGVKPAWNGLFIKSEPLPETLRNRGRII